MKSLSKEQIDLLFEAMPAEAVKQHPSKSYLSVVSPIYVIERLNQVFGVGAWQFRSEPVSEIDGMGNQGKMCVVKGILDITDYNIHLEQYGGNNNVDTGDAYKGAATDALTKIASYLGVAFDVYKGKHDEAKVEQITRLAPNRR